MTSIWLPWIISNHDTVEFLHKLLRFYSCCVTLYIIRSMQFRYFIKAHQTVTNLHDQARTLQPPTGKREARRAAAPRRTGKGQRNHRRSGEISLLWLPSFQFSKLDHFQNINFNMNAISVGVMFLWKILHITLVTFGWRHTYLRGNLAPAERKFWQIFEECICWLWCSMEALSVIICTYREN